MRICNLLLAWVWVMGAQAQTTIFRERDSVKSLVFDYFNNKEADSLYALTGAAFHKELSPDAFRKVSRENLFPLGKIREIKFESENERVGKYKVSFGMVNLSMYLSLDSAQKIETFLFQPYKDDNARKTVKPASSNPLLTELDKKVDEIIGPYMIQLNTVGVSVGILRNGQTYFYHYGETVKDNKQLPTENTIYEIGSITKTFTAILLADAALHKLVKLDDPVNKYLPDSIGQLQFEGTPVTLQTLSNHSSGLPRLPSNLMVGATNPLDPYGNYDVKALFSFLKNFHVNTKPGTVYEYSNLAAGLLGTILERISGKKYEDLVEVKILKPLHMDHTKQLMTQADSGKMAKGYDENGRFAPSWNFKALAGAGSIRSTVSDLLKYAAANLDLHPGKLQAAIQLTHQITFEPPTARLGLAWHIIKPGQQEIFFHNGGTGGYRSYLGINPANNTAVVILSNAAISNDNEGNALIKWLESQ